MLLIDNLNDSSYTLLASCHPKKKKKKEHFLLYHLKGSPGAQIMAGVNWPSYK